MGDYEVVMNVFAKQVSKLDTIFFVAHVCYPEREPSEMANKWGDQQMQSSIVVARKKGQIKGQA